MPKEIKETQYYQSDFESFSSNGASSAPAWMKTARSAGISNFSALGFPTIKNEDWKFTNIVPLLKVPFRYASEHHRVSVTREKLSPYVYSESAKSYVAVVNGRFSPSLSNLSALPSGVEIESLEKAATKSPDLLKRFLNKRVPNERSAFATLNTAYLRDGVLVRIPKGVNIEVPIQILIYSSQADDGTPLVSYPRNLIILEEGARAAVVETYASGQESVSLSDAVTEIFVGPNAALDFVKEQREGSNAFHVGTMQVTQEKESRFTCFSLALGSKIARNDLNIEIAGERCESMLDGLYITAGDQLIDHHTIIDHTQPECSSREVFKGIVAGNSRAVFNGKIFVRQIAQKTDSKQTNKNLLLSDTATVDTKPQLEIFADDVKCTHGATVGGMDPMSLFYVKSRGISEEAARGILTTGFAAEVTKYINDANLRQYIDSLIIAKLADSVVKSELPEIVHSATADFSQRDFQQDEPHS
ncbi:MAG: Fe-S cluster assembly protein SufD [Bacteroidota bacterium]|nr:Fe-S cluster assembly protein SufD [Bacteroidota bacterium]